jgi:integrase
MKIRKKKFIEENSKITSEYLIKLLTREKTRLLLEAVSPDSSNNPWRDSAVCYRNQLIVHMLLSTGCRKGELLQIKVTDLDPDEMSVKICMDSYNAETHSRSRKNLSRKIMLPDDIYQMSEDYIMRFISPLKWKNKSLNLFTSHAKGAGKAEPLSLSSLDNIFNALSKKLDFKISSNTLRHTWNYMFSKNMEHYLASGELPEAVIEHCRNYLMGWKKGTSSAKIFTQNHPKKMNENYLITSKYKKHIEGPV